MRFTISTTFKLPVDQAISSTSFLFVPKSHSKGDVLFIGANSGQIFFCLPQQHQPKYQRVARSAIAGISASVSQSLSHHQDDHISDVQCLMHSTNQTLVLTSSLGLLFSGSKDRTIKVWNINISESKKTLLQSLVGHTGPITAIRDCYDGSFISSSVDGTVKVWSPQVNREMMLNPFFVCISTVSVDSTAWLTCMAINHQSIFTCYIADSIGSISVYKKSAFKTSSNTTTAFTSTSCNNNAALQLQKHTRYDHIHDLGISDMNLIVSEDLLVTISFDSTCKLSDTVTGHLIHKIVNQKMCMYTGVVYNNGHLILVDELGYFGAFHLVNGKVVDYRSILKPNNSKHERDIVISHKDILFKYLCHYEGNNHSHHHHSGNSTVSSQYLSLFLNQDGAVSVGLFNIEDNTICSEFNGHSGAVVDILIPTVDSSTSSTNNSASNSATTASKALLISKDEDVIFSAGTDYTIRCWDQFDCKENYQFKDRVRNTEVTCIKGLWSINSFVTGHENGMIATWHADSGTKSCSYVLKNSIYCMIEAVQSYKHLLIGADYSGKIAVWNLSLLLVNPGEIPYDHLFSGYHDIDDPSIFSMAYHQRTRTIFTGGSDKTIRYFKLDSEVHKVMTGSRDTVSTLQCSDNLLMSGNDSGEVLLWGITTCSSNSGYTDSISSVGSSSFNAEVYKSSLPQLILLYRWTLNSVLQSQPSRAIAYLVEFDSRAVVVQGGKTGTSLVWYIDYDFDRLRDTSCYNINDSAASEIIYSTAVTNATPIEVNSSNADIDGGVIMYTNYDDCRDIKVSLHMPLDHPEHEVTCITASHKGRRATELSHVFLGTSEGVIYRYLAK